VTQVEGDGPAQHRASAQVDDRDGQAERSAADLARAGRPGDALRVVIRRAWPGLRGGGGDGLACAAAMAAVGPLLGLLWAATAPKLDVAAVLGGSSAELDVQSGVDAYFGLIAAVAGVVGGVLAFWRGADAGWPVPAGLAVGGLAGAALAGQVGHMVRSPQLLEALPSVASSNDVVVGLVDMRVRSGGLYLVYPVTALAVLALLIWATATFTRGRLSSGKG
jgi:hypothetical protein